MRALGVRADPPGAYLDTHPVPDAFSAFWAGTRDGSAGSSETYALTASIKPRVAPAYSLPRAATGDWAAGARVAAVLAPPRLSPRLRSVSYTHLTLPTILLV